MTEHVKSLRVIDPRIARESQVVDVIAEGPASVVYTTVTAPDPTGLSPIFTIQPGSVLMGVNRTMRLHVVGTVTVTGTNFSALASGSRVCLRQFPLHSIMQNVQAQINNTTLSLGSVNLYTSALAAVSNTSASMASSGSTYPSTPDIYTDYNMALGISGGCFDTIGRGVYGDAVVSGRTAQITSITITGAGGTSLAVGFDISEDLILSPFNYSEREQKYLYGVQTMVVNLSYSNVHRMLCIATTGGVTFTGASLALTKQQLEVSYVTPDDSSLIERPLKHVYDMAQVQYNATSAGASIAAGATFSITSNAIEFPVIPSKLVVMCTYSQTDLQDATKSLSDVCFPIVDKSCTVQFGTRGGLFSGASSVNLWEVSRRGGSHAKYPIWAGLPEVTSMAPVEGSTPGVYAGSPLIIDVAADLSLPAGGSPVVPGMNVRTQYSFTATFKNHTGQTVNNPRLIILALTPGYLEIKDGASDFKLGGVSLEAARRAPVAPLLQADVLSALRQTEGISGGAHHTGGGFLDDLWDGIKTVVSEAATSAAPGLPGYLPLGPAARGGDMIGGRARSKLFGGRAMASGQY